MMRPEVAVAMYLGEAPAVAALGVADRIYQLHLPQRPTLPAIRVQLIDEPAMHHLRGGSLLIRSRVQVDTYAAELDGGDAYQVADALAAAVHEALDGAIFSIAGSPGTIEILAIYRDNRMPTYEPEELRLVGIMQDFIVWSRQPMN